MIILALQIVSLFLGIALLLSLITILAWQYNHEGMVLHIFLIAFFFTLFVTLTWLIK